MQDLTVATSSQATKRAFKKRSILLYQGEVPRMTYVVKSGIIKMYTINNAGEEQVVAFCGPNDFFPTTWVLGKTTTTLYYYETLTDCEILTLPRDVFCKIIYDPKFLHKTLDYLAGAHSSLLMRITALEQSRANEKIMFTLYYLIFRYGKQTKPGHYMIDLPLTHQIIASLVGLTRETTSIEISKLKRQKVLQYKGKAYVVNKPLLERMLGEDSFNDLSL